MKSNHEVHQYQLVDFGRGGHKVYKCMLPNCTHYLPQLALALNRLSLCWGNCGNAVMMTQETLSRMIKKPMCASCREERMKRRESLIVAGKLADEQGEEI